MPKNHHIVKYITCMLRIIIKKEREKNNAHIFVIVSLENS